VNNLPVCPIQAVESNFMGEEGKALIREALQGKAGFELLF
jgi:hypothetical protein